MEKYNSPDLPPKHLVDVSLHRRDFLKDSGTVITAGATLTSIHAPALAQQKFDLNEVSLLIKEMQFEDAADLLLSEIKNKEQILIDTNADKLFQKNKAEGKSTDIDYVRLEDLIKNRTRKEIAELSYYLSKVRFLEMKKSEALLYAEKAATLDYSSKQYSDWLGSLKK